MGPSPRYHQPKRERCEKSVEHELPLWARPNGEYTHRA